MTPERIEAADRIIAAARDLWPWARNWLPDEAMDQGARAAVDELQAALAAFTVLPRAAPSPGEEQHAAATPEELCLLCLRTKADHGTPPHSFMSNLTPAPSPGSTAEPVRCPRPHHLLLPGEVCPDCQIVPVERPGSTAEPGGCDCEAHGLEQHACTAEPGGEDEVTARTDCGCRNRHVCGRGLAPKEGKP